MFKTIAALLVGACLLAWFVMPSQQDYPNENILQDFYVQYLGRNNSEASKQFGNLIKSDKKVVLKNFKIEKCMDAEEKYICRVAAQIETPKDGLQKRSLEFHVKKTDGNITLKQI